MDLSKFAPAPVDGEARPNSRLLHASPSGTSEASPGLLGPLSVRVPAEAGSVKAQRHLSPSSLPVADRSPVRTPCADAPCLEPLPGPDAQFGRPIRTLGLDGPLARPVRSTETDAVLPRVPESGQATTSPSQNPPSDLQSGSPLEPPSGIPRYPPTSDSEPFDSPEEEDLEIDPAVDPLQEQAPPRSQTMAEWEAAVRFIQPREPVVEDAALQRQKVFDLLERIRNVDLRSDPSSQAEAESILTALPDTLQNPEQFVAGSFTACYPAWAALLEKSKRKSAKTVLGWLRNGVKPQFVGTADAKEKKRDLVVGMLKRRVPAAEIPSHAFGGLAPFRRFPEPQVVLQQLGLFIRRGHQADWLGSRVGG